MGDAPVAVGTLDESWNREWAGVWSDAAVRTRGLPIASRCTTPRREKLTGSTARTDIERVFSDRWCTHLVYEIFLNRTS